MNRGESGFLEMLKEVTGTQAFDEKMQKMNKALEEAQGQKKVLHKVLREIELKL